MSEDQDIARETDKGRGLATQLAWHLKDMGAAQAGFEIEYEGEMYRITIERTETVIWHDPAHN